MSGLEQRGCSIFTCDRRRGNFCCADCGFNNSQLRNRCKNPCLNNPERCNCALPSATQYIDRAKWLTRYRAGGNDTEA